MPSGSSTLIGTPKRRSIRHEKRVLPPSKLLWSCRSLKSFCKESNRNSVKIEGMTRAPQTDEAAGFREIDTPGDYPEAFKPAAVFMEMTIET